jgi:C1A family cysteine protease
MEHFPAKPFTCVSARGIVFAMADKPAPRTAGTDLPSRRTNARYGWVPDLPDARDLLFSATRAAVAKLPPSIDLTAGMPPVYDQGQLGSCTANALGAAFEFDLKKQHSKDFMPSRLFIYYNERAIEGSISTDSGAQIRDGVKTLAKQGVCAETEWPYDPAKFAKKPTAACFTDGKKTKVASYQRVAQNLNQLKGALAAGFPVVIGFTVYDSFESDEVAKTGVMPMPAPAEHVLGGHAVLVVGYDDASQRFRVRNSWGTSWGQKGYFTMPYEYLTNSGLSSDFWTLRLIG